MGSKATTESPHPHKQYYIHVGSCDRISHLRFVYSLHLKCNTFESSVGFGTHYQVGLKDGDNIFWLTTKPRVRPLLGTIHVCENTRQDDEHTHIVSTYDPFLFVQWVGEEPLSVDPIVSPETSSQDTTPRCRVDIKVTTKTPLLEVTNRLVQTFTQWVNIHPQFNKEAREIIEQHVNALRLCTDPRKVEKERNEVLRRLATCPRDKHIFLRLTNFDKAPQKFDHATYVEALQWSMEGGKSEPCKSPQTKQDDEPGKSPLKKQDDEPGKSPLTKHDSGLPCETEENCIPLNEHDNLLITIEPNLTTSPTKHDLSLELQEGPPPLPLKQFNVPFKIKENLTIPPTEMKSLTNCFDGFPINYYEEKKDEIDNFYNSLLAEYKVSLSKDQISAIYLYCDEMDHPTVGSLYRLMNTDLTDRDRFVKRKIDKWKYYSAILLSAMKKLEEVRGVILFKGIPEDVRTTSNAWKVGEEKVFYSFLSASPNLGTAKNFAWTKGKIGTLLELRNVHYGRVVSPYSRFHEEEVLFPPGVKFKVLDIQLQQVEHQGSLLDYLHIQLEQVENQESLLD